MLRLGLGFCLWVFEFLFAWEGVGDFLGVEALVGRKGEGGEIGEGGC